MKKVKFLKTKCYAYAVYLIATELFDELVDELELLSIMSGEQPWKATDYLFAEKPDAPPANRKVH